MAPDQEICCTVKISEHYAKRPGNTDAMHRVYYMLEGMTNLYKAWPERCKINCWYCRLPFDTQPIPIVVAYDETKDVYECEGVACTAPCAMAYLNEQLGAAKALRLVYQASMMINVFGWPRDKPVPTANTWKALKEFGGHQPVHVWRQQEYPIRVRTGAFVPAQVLLECRKRGTAQEEVNEQTSTAADSVGSGFDNQNLRNLKRGQTIDTMDKLRAEHPDFVENEQIMMPSIFDEWMATEPLPTEAERAQILENKRVEKSSRRKRAAPAADSDRPAKRIRKKADEPELNVQLKAQTNVHRKTPTPAKRHEPPSSGKRQRTFMDMVI